ncbi:MAG: hypothetical protein WC862_03950 [Patescibacteria group bacterium]
MNKQFYIDDRVKISEDYHWAQLATGVIKVPPKATVDLRGDWNGYTRTVKTLKGDKLFYWILFDNPQYDADGDGPYSDAEIDSEYLLRLAP